MVMWCPANTQEKVRFEERRFNGQETYWSGWPRGRISGLVEARLPQNACYGAIDRSDRGGRNLLSLQMADAGSNHFSIGSSNYHCDPHRAEPASGLGTIDSLEKGLGAQITRE